MDKLSISCRLTVPSGELEINDGKFYVLAADTMGTRQISWRRQTAQSPFIDGTYTVSAVMENVTETIGVYVYGSDAGDMRRRLNILCDAFGQLTFTITWDSGEDAWAWMCQTSDYSVDTRREFQHSRMALATFNVPRVPAVIEL